MDKVYQVVELVGTSKKSQEDAIANAIKMATEKGHRIDWFEVVEQRGYVEDAKVAYYQVVLKLGCA